jgi:hypothetical protein
MASLRSYLHLLFFLAAVSKTINGFVTPFLKTKSCTAAFVNQPVLFSDVSDSQADVAEAAETENAIEETEAPSASDDDASSEKKRVIRRERHTLFLGNLPFGMFMIKDLCEG